MEIKVGDKVLIKGIDWYERNKDDDGDIVFEIGAMFVKPMKKFCGKELTVKQVYRGGFQVEGAIWDFSVECVEKVIPNTDDMCSKPSTIPRVGDYVRIKSKEWYDRYKDVFGSVNVTYVFTEGMVKYCGGVYEVIRINEGIITLDTKDSDDWSFSLKMFNEVIPKEEYEKSQSISEGFTKLQGEIVGSIHSTMNALEFTLHPLPKLYADTLFGISEEKIEKRNKTELINHNKLLKVKL